MANKNIIRSFIASFIMACVMLSGCGRTVTNNPNETSPAKSSGDTPSETSLSNDTSQNSETSSPIDSISGDDFDVSYKGIIINDKTSLEELAKLNIPIGDDNENIDIKAAGWNNDMDYYWYQVFYPSKKNTDFQLDYLYNSTQNTGYIISIELKSIPTKRGLTVGDNFDKVKALYGDDITPKYNTDTTDYISYQHENHTLDMVLEKATGKIIKIEIDYNRDKAMKDMDITSFD